MWLDAEGVAHAVALPDPGIAVEDSLLTAILAATDRETAQIRELVDGLEDEIDQLLVDGRIERPDHPDEYVEVAIFRDSIRDTPGSPDLPIVERVRTAVLAVELNFRLDAVLAVGDLVAMQNREPEQRGRTRQPAAPLGPPMFRGTDRGPASPMR